MPHLDIQSVLQSSDWHFQPYSSSGSSLHSQPLFTFWNFWTGLPDPFQDPLLGSFWQYLLGASLIIEYQFGASWRHESFWTAVESRDGHLYLWPASAASEIYHPLAETLALATIYCCCSSATLEIYKIATRILLLCSIGSPILLEIPQIWCQIWNTDQKQSEL